MSLTAAEQAASADKNAFVISRTFDAPRDVLWQAFTDPARMKHWWGPKGAKVLVSNMDLRPGGTYHYGMQMPDGMVMWGRMIYREVAAPERLLFINSFSDESGGVSRHPLAPTWPLELFSRFTFEDLGDRTKLTVLWAPLSPTLEERAAFDAGHASMTGGWTGTLDRLTAYLARP